MELLLFDLPPVPLQVSESKCKQCEHCERHRYGRSVFFYCGLLKSRMTANGKLKIKANKPACLSLKIKQLK